mmetsp:Transcript_47050/g.102386  ORF Transcript_47050/g.102386 Transcript_47050/m.102386 type:complete len:204 (+) Transcript_47050:205-816(+)
MQQEQLSVPVSDQRPSPWQTGHRTTILESEGTVELHPVHFVQGPREGSNRKQCWQRTVDMPRSHGNTVDQGISKLSASEDPLPLTACTARGIVGRRTLSAAHITSCCVGASSTMTNCGCNGGSVARRHQSKGSPPSEKYRGPQTSYFSTGLEGSWHSGSCQLISNFRWPALLSRHRAGPAAFGSRGTSTQTACADCRRSSLAW